MSTTLKISWLCLFLIVGLLLTASYLKNSGSLASGDQEIRKTISPDGDFSVDILRTLKVNPDRPNVIASVTKDKNLFVDQIMLYPEGAFDPDFELQYPDYKWENNQTLRLGVKSYFDRPSDELVVINKSEKTAKYIRLDSDEIYLLFDIKPNETIRFPVYWPEVRGVNFKHIGARGMLNDGTPLYWAEGDFPFHKETNLRLCLDITDSNLNVQECN